MKNNRRGYSLILVIVAIGLVSAAVVLMASVTGNTATQSSKLHADAIKRNVKLSIQSWYDANDIQMKAGDTVKFEFDTQGFANARGSIKKSNDKTQMKLSFAKYNWKVNYTWEK